MTIREKLMKQMVDNYWAQVKIAKRYNAEITSTFTTEDYLRNIAADEGSRVTEEEIQFALEYNKSLAN